VLAIFTVKGDTQDLLARYDRAMARIIEVSPARPLSHACVPTDQGFRAYDVWESREVLQDFAENSLFRQTLAETGLPEPEVEVFPVHRLGW
jgi:hypothetical protein